jgi:hypothetical protein
MEFNIIQIMCGTIVYITYTKNYISYVIYVVVMNLDR